MNMKTCGEAADILKDVFPVTAAKLKKGCLSGKYPFIRICSRIIVDVDELRQILAREREDNLLLSTDELSQRTGLCPSTIRRATKEGWLPYRIVGRNMRYDLTAVQQAIMERTENRHK